MSMCVFIISSPFIKSTSEYRQLDEEFEYSSDGSEDFERQEVKKVPGIVRYVQWYRHFLVSSWILNLLSGQQS